MMWLLIEIIMIVITHYDRQNYHNDNNDDDEIGCHRLQNINYAVNLSFNRSATENP